MICITGQEKRLQDLLERLSICSVCPMQEIRLDALQRPELPGGSLPIKPGKLLVTCRRTWDGGLFNGSEPDRIKILEDALDRRPGWIDLEADLPEELAKPLMKKAHREGVKVLRSLHQERGSIREALQKLSKVPGEGIKLAAKVEDLLSLKAFLEAPRDRIAVLVGMGSAGILSRALYPRFRSAWTYVSATPWPDASTGIPDIETATSWGMPVKESAFLYVLLGDATITTSPGAKVYNHLFRERGYNAIYLPAITSDMERAFHLLQSLGLRGASVTIPFKEKAASLGVPLSREARSAGAVNTLYLTSEGEWCGNNTDIPAVQALMDRLAHRPLRKGVVLGTGGFAKACAFALSERGVHVDLWDRKNPRDDLAHQEFDILVNATPVGDLPEEVDLKDKVVLDGVLAPSLTPLARQAVMQGAYFAGGAAIWGEQGSRQLELFGGPKIETDTLIRLAVDLGGIAAPNPA